MGFLATYTSGDPSGLYERIKRFADLGYVRLLLRDASVRPAAERPLIECDSFSDVYASWIEQDPKTAWINPEITEVRGRYFEDLDSWGRGDAIRRYSYRDVKARFMADVRRAHALVETGHVLPGLDGLSAQTLASLADILSRDWFSLSDIYRVLHEHGIPSDAPVLRYHGLINELAYADVISGSVVGVDTASTTYERLLWATGDISTVAPSDRANDPAEPIEEVLRRANAVLTAPDLSLLGVLRPEEVAAIREGGRGYFDVIKLSQDEAFVAANPDLQADLFRMTRDYWAFICDQISTMHPAAAKRPTRLGIFLGKIPLPVARLTRRAFGFAVNVGTPAVSELGLPPPANVLAAETVKEAKRSFSLRFLVVSERPEMKRIRQVVPAHSWVSAESPKLYLPPGT